VGNITVGGTGKTPMTLRLAREFVDAGFRTVIVSRGYRGAAEARGGMVSDGRTLLMDADAAGDEPFMMAETLIASQKNVPVVVGRNRHAAGLQAVSRFAPEIILLDDAFQHLRLRRDLDLLLLDGRSPFGNGRVLPRGPLREPLSALARADAVILTRCPPGFTMAARDRDRLPRGLPCFRAFHRPFIRKVIRRKVSRPEISRKATPPSNGPDRVRSETAVNATDVFAFSGIARNGEFIRTTEALGFRVTGQAGFPDHHPYAPSDLAALSAAAAASGAGAIATTEKDYARMDHRFPWPLDLFVIGIEMDFGADEPAFRRFIHRRMGAPDRPESERIND
jgi:tetraacyldisaccharide 4'-kinase